MRLSERTSSCLSIQLSNCPCSMLRPCRVRKFAQLLFGWAFCPDTRADGGFKVYVDIGNVPDSVNATQNAADLGRAARWMIEISVTVVVVLPLLVMIAALMVLQILFGVKFALDRYAVCDLVCSLRPGVAKLASRTRRHNACRLWLRSGSLLLI